MKQVKVFSLLLAFTLMLSTGLLAQEKKVMSTPEERSATLTEWMKTNLKLTEDQVRKVQDINLKYATKKQAIKDNTTQAKEDKMKVLKENETAKETELKEVLTPDQFKIYEARKDEMKKEMKKAKEAGGGGVKNG